MDCPGEGELRAWLDRETDLNLEGHLVQCPH